MPVTHAHYIGLTTPRCSRTYSVAPCRAQLVRADGSAPNAVYLDSAYARRAAGLSGAADSGMGTGSFWYTASDLSTNQTLFAGETTLGGGTARFTIRFVNNVLRIVGVNSSGTTVLDIRATSLPIEAWTHVMFSFDLANSARRHIYVDNTSNLSVTTFTVAGTIDYTLADWSLGALANGSEVASNIAFAELWFEDGLYLDLSVQSNREKFLLNDHPVNLGANGEGPTGSSPIAFFANRVEDNWHLNLGTGGGFNTTSGTGGENNVEFGTGSEKCFNTLATCQDPENYAEVDPAQIMYFAEDVNVEVASRFLDDNPVFPFIKSIDFDSTIVSLGDNMGQRGKVTVTMRDAPHNDLPATLFDKYPTERSYDAYTQGSFWGKFRARNRFLRFQPLYLFTVKKFDIVGIDDQGTIELRTYVIDSINGPDENGEFKIVAKDILKVVDGDFAVAPLPSPGYLASDITDVATTATISPSGILGGSDYPSSGIATIGGNEIVIYTKTGGDGISLDARGAFGTTAVSHSAQDRLQVAYSWEPSSPEEIIADLLETYGGIDPSLIDFDAWSAEIAANLGTLYTMLITEPTSVATLVSEMIQQIGGAIWWDDVNSQIRLQILRAIPTDADRFNEDNVIANSFRVTEQETKRITQVSVYYAQINPTLKIDETRNYASVFTVTDDITEILVGGRSQKTIFARGIGSGGQAVAERLAQKYLSRYVEPPRKFNFEILKYSGVNAALGGGYLIGGGDLVNPTNLNLFNNQQGMWALQADTGARVEVPVQVTRINPIGNTIQVEAEEMLFTAFGSDIDPTNHTVIFDVSRNDVNLQEVHDNIYQEALSGDTVNCYINSGVVIGSNDVGTPAFIVGSFNSGVTVNIFVLGRIQGHGGHGADITSVSNFQNGEAGGTALYTRQSINLDSSAGQIWGGGGGGGMSAGVSGGGTFANSGGGGAGTSGGRGGIVTVGSTYRNLGNSGSADAGGSAPFSPAGGNGGGPGLAGQNASGGSIANTNGGAAGNAIDGNAFITHVADGDHRGGVI